MDGASYLDVGVICAWCANALVGKLRKGQEYCSKACSLAHWKIKNPDSYMGHRRNAAMLGRPDLLYATAKDNPCVDCKIKYDPVCMDFDHRDPALKTKEVSRLRRQSITLRAFRAEIEKCDLVCSNCHRVRTQVRHGR